MWLAEDKRGSTVRKGASHSKVKVLQISAGPAQRALKKGSTRRRQHFFQREQGFDYP